MGQGGEPDAVKNENEATAAVSSSQEGMATLAPGVKELRTALALQALDEVTCRRFLKANNGHVGKAAKQYRGYIAWRERENIDAVLEEPPHEPAIEAELNRVSMRNIEGYDLSGRPVMVGALGRVDLQALKKKGITAAMLIRRHQRTMEDAVRRVYAAPDPSRGQLTIIDLSGASVSRFFWAWQYIREVAHMGQAYYPEVLGKMCFLRVPPATCWLIEKIKNTLLNPDTRDKVQLSSGDSLPAIRANLPPTTPLPSELGIAEWPERPQGAAANDGAPSALDVRAAPPSPSAAVETVTGDEEQPPSSQAASVPACDDDGNWWLRSALGRPPASSQAAPPPALAEDGGSAGGEATVAKASTPVPPPAVRVPSDETIVEPMAALPPKKSRTSRDGKQPGRFSRLLSPSRQRSAPSTPPKSAVKLTTPRALPPHPDEWPARPVTLRVACGAEMPGVLVSFNDPSSVFAIETEYFSGHGYVRLRGLPGEPHEYFEGKRRWMSMVFQGRVKQQMSMADCATGYEFDAPLRHLPGRMVIRMALNFVRAIAPSMSVEMGENPSILNPLFQTVQRLHVALPGEEPEITSTFDERTGLLGGVFAEKAIGWKERKKMFTSRAATQRYTLDPDYVYTMEFYEDKLIPSTLELNVGPMKFALAKVLGAGTARPQPLPTMAKLGFEPHSQRYLFNLELWNECQFVPSALVLATPTSRLRSPFRSAARTPKQRATPASANKAKTSLWNEEAEANTAAAQAEKRRGWFVRRRRGRHTILGGRRHNEATLATTTTV